jgi:hypothetical protein
MRDISWDRFAEIPRAANGCKWWLMHASLSNQVWDTAWNSPITFHEIGILAPYKGTRHHSTTNTYYYAGKTDPYMVWHLTLNGIYAKYEGNSEIQFISMLKCVHHMP